MTTQSSPDFDWARHDITITIAPPSTRKKRKKAGKLWKRLKRYQTSLDKCVKKGLRKHLFGGKVP